MLPLSRFHLWLAFIAIMLLRVAVGFHFYKEGTAKLDSGSFTAAYFLQSSKGPLAPYFQSLLDDGDGRIRLCVSRADEGSRNYQIDPELTFAIWDDFVDRASSYYGFDSPEIEALLVQRRAKMAEQIQEARAGAGTDIDTQELELQRVADEANILRLREQPESSNKILKSHREEMQSWLDVHRDEVLTYFETQGRLQGFDRDGQSNQQVATEVSSLRGQIDTIRQDRKKQFDGWSYEIETIWNSLESQINALAVGEQAKRQPLRIHRPFAQKYSKLRIINQVIPWFDVVIGILLIVGLFTRFASLAAAVFLASVIATQPPWFPGTTPTYYQAVEFFAVLVLFATCAGRMGGLDFFLSRRPQQTESGMPPRP